MFWNLLNVKCNPLNPLFPSSYTTSIMYIPTCKHMYPQSHASGHWKVLKCCGESQDRRSPGKTCRCEWSVTFATYNFIGANLPEHDTTLGLRVIMGFCASAISGTCSNSIRVLKMYEQSHRENLSYPQVVKSVIEESGIRGLM